MTVPSRKPSYLKLAGVWPPKVYRIRIIATIILALCPPLVCAFLASTSGRWDLFERSGSITTALGLLLASRRYIRYGVLELAILQAHDQERDAAEVLEDIFTGKLGLGLSAFGPIVWGWGLYLGWWSFSYLLVWALFAARDAYRDSKKADLVGVR